MREHERAEGEHIDETGVSGGAKRRGLSQQAVTCWPGFGETIYIYIYTTVFGDPHLNCPSLDGTCSITVVTHRGSSPLHGLDTGTQPVRKREED
jgi:hypothetical protein